MPATKKHLFKDSPYYDKDKLTLALFGTKYQDADIDYYHEKADTWSEANGEKKLNWLATLKNWMATNMKEGKFVDKNYQPMPKKMEEITENLTNSLTGWQKDEETPPQTAPQPQPAKQLELPTDWSEHWEDLQEKAKKGISMIIVMPIYDWLTETGKLNLSKDEKIDLFMRAKFQYMGQLEAGGTPQDRALLRKMKTENWGNDPELLERVRNKAKILAARDYLYQSVKPQHSLK